VFRYTLLATLFVVSFTSAFAVSSGFAHPRIGDLRGVRRHIK